MIKLHQRPTVQQLLSVVLLQTDCTWGQTEAAVAQGCLNPGSAGATGSSLSSPCAAASCHSRSCLMWFSSLSSHLPVWGRLVVDTDIYTAARPAHRPPRERRPARGCFSNSSCCLSSFRHLSAWPLVCVQHETSERHCLFSHPPVNKSISQRVGPGSVS